MSLQNSSNSSWELWLLRRIILGFIAMLCLQSRHHLRGAGRVVGGRTIVGKFKKNQVELFVRRKLNLSKLRVFIYPLVWFFGRTSIGTMEIECCRFAGTIHPLYDAKLDPSHLCRALGAYGHCLKLNCQTVTEVLVDCLARANNLLLSAEDLPWHTNLRHPWASFHHLSNTTWICQGT